MAANPVTKGLESLVNQYLRLDPDSEARLAELHGKVIAVEVCFTPPSAKSTGFTLYFLPQSKGLEIAPEVSETPTDVLIRGTPMALARQFYQGGYGITATDIEVQGDLRVGKTFQTLLSGIQIDWEEQMARIVGDVAAHQMGNALRQTWKWTTQSVQRVLQNAGEYLQYEARELPPQGTLNDFIDGVDTLRSDAERLEARVRRLQKILAAKPSGNT